MTDALAKINRILTAGGLLALVGLVLCILITFGSGTTVFFQSYLVAYIFWFGLGMGSLAWLMIHHLSGGQWGFISRRLLEAGAMTLPVLALLFVVVIAGMEDIYVWTDTEYALSDPLIAHKLSYLNVGAYTLRALIFFVLWVAGAYLLYKWSSDQDNAANGDFRIAKRMRAISGIGLVVYVITMTMAPVDWAMSIEPHFFSAMYGVLYMVGQGLSTIAFLILILAVLSKSSPFSEALSTRHVDDFGKLLLAFVILWTYVSYGQFVIIWSGNLPEFTPWYIHRTEDGWVTISLLLMIGHFGLPFLILLSRKLKQTMSLLWPVAAWIVLMRLLEIFWLIAPDLSSFEGFAMTSIFSYLAAHLLLGGIWLTVFAWMLRQRPLLPANDLRNDPRYARSHGHGDAALQASH